MDNILDARAKPPNEIRAVYKHFHKACANLLDEDPDLVQFQDGNAETNLWLKRCLDLPPEMRQAFMRFMNSDSNIEDSPMAMYEVPDVPGLYIYPSLLPVEVQFELLERLLHRDLCNPKHQTNVHMHYHVPYPPSTREIPSSFFDRSTSGCTFQPLNPDVHKSITNEQFLNKKLRWATLGGQYDWTKKVYPSGPPPAFPSDIKQLIEDVFPMKAEAAIVNLYSPGDTLSLHRDVSEECNRPLVSISLGCDALFIAGLEGESQDEAPRVATIRLRSGDAVLMSGESRYAWHGVPKVLEGTCPNWMEDWPCRSEKDEEGRFEHWRGWMKGKRVNLNVRQMFE
ncbi:related to oxidoreductase, 2OG-Fe(II) oxygenase family family [Ramularia collo-cygni]|uniref:mRNA N(6)-methyladenine demethylase n=1 Tax=Ramularia collo-cygni TaxID=112498 RepID=A0A2D3VL51_9PEZI|nr:related to oxidoreductase, 2OG-Fe(II) oxygenase family family [Ramularia collo-cygni]CZT23204.1 related to oxidoreductase, 2OG-Fe(II) oxygenase family family [Ramularia collo-cygni]